MIGRLPMQGNADKPIPTSRSVVALSKELLCERTSTARVGRTIAVSALPRGTSTACCRKASFRALPGGAFPVCAADGSGEACDRGRGAQSLTVSVWVRQSEAFLKMTAAGKFEFSTKKAAKNPFPCRPADLSRLHYNAIPEPCQAAVFTFFQAYFSHNSMIWNKLGEINEKNMSNARESV